MPTNTIISSPKKAMKLFSVRELETLKTTSAFYLPGCPNVPVPVLTA